MDGRDQQKEIGNMSEVSDAFLTRAAESLAGAESEFDHARYNNAANREYFACFHAAIAALDLAGVRSPDGKREWTHAFVQAQFSGLLVNRRKRYSAEMRDTLNTARTLRERADYDTQPVGATQVARTLRRVRAFVATVAEREGATR
jgi:uncharacterized protein (UPF0332 family)